MKEIDTELLVTLALKNGGKIAFLRDADHTVRVCHEDHCVILPNASGEVTTSLFALLSPFGEIEEENEQF
jgi:hypothetical protein